MDEQRMRGQAPVDRGDPDPIVTKPRNPSSVRTNSARRQSTPERSRPALLSVFMAVEAKSGK